MWAADDAISTPLVCINPLYAAKNTPSTAASEDLNTAQYTPATKARPQRAHMEIISGGAPSEQPSSTAAAATPLVSAAGAKSLFYSAATETQEEAEKQGEPCNAMSAAGGESLPTQIEIPSSQTQTDAAVESSDDSPAALNHEESDHSGIMSATPDKGSSQEPEALKSPDSSAPRRAFPKTPMSAVRRSRVSEHDEPTPIRNPMRIATPARYALSAVTT